MRCFHSFHPLYSQDIGHSDYCLLRSLQNFVDKKIQFIGRHQKHRELFFVEQDKKNGSRRIELFER